MSEIRTAYVIDAVRSGIAADQDDFTVAELRVAARLHLAVGELLSAWQYTEMAERKEAEDGTETRERPS